MRISLTFRSISTFCRQSDGRVFGQGAKAKTLGELNRICSSSSSSGGGGGGKAAATAAAAAAAASPANREDEFAEARRMLSAFSHENQWDKFDWDQAYGRGFDITSFRALREHKGWD